MLAFVCLFGLVFWFLVCGCLDVVYDACLLAVDSSGVYWRLCLCYLLCLIVLCLVDCVVYCCCCICGVCAFVAFGVLMFANGCFDFVVCYFVVACYFGLWLFIAAGLLFFLGLRFLICYCYVLLCLCAGSVAFV